jgi:hypothetical protein
MPCTRGQQATLCTLEPAASELNFKVTFAIISRRSVFEDLSLRTKEWREAESYCPLPSVVHSILHTGNYGTKHKPQRKKNHL